jgi:hypothetical protein
MQHHTPQQTLAAAASQQQCAEVLAGSLLLLYHVVRIVNEAVRPGLDQPRAAPGAAGIDGVMKRGGPIRKFRIHTRRIRVPEEQVDHLERSPTGGAHEGRPRVTFAVAGPGGGTQVEQGPDVLEQAFADSISERGYILL